MPTSGAHSAFNVELMRRPRWLLGACLRGVPDCFKKVLTVKSLSQTMFIRLVVLQFGARCRKGQAKPKSQGPSSAHRIGTTT